ncbi:MAG: hypothetical protein IPM82_21850 [Saprospiraceae bacterium]|nr:hypothetical protein [Saprospiraceae bacterium]
MIKKKHFLRLVLVCCTLVLLIASCKKDDDTATDETTQVTGTYLGTYVETTDGGAVTVDDVETSVTKESATEIKVNIKVIPGLAGVVFTATMTDETHFSVSKFTLNDAELEGNGSLTGTTLNIDLDKVGTASDKVTFEGTKQ